MTIELIKIIFREKSNQKCQMRETSLRLIASLATAHKNHLNCLTVTVSL